MSYEYQSQPDSETAIELNPALGTEEILTPQAHAYLANLLLAHGIGASSAAEAPKPEDLPIPDNIELGQE
jgi:hypothetical protein